MVHVTNYPLLTISDLLNLSVLTLFLQIPPDIFVFFMNMDREFSYDRDKDAMAISAASENMLLAAQALLEVLAGTDSGKQGRGQTNPESLGKSGAYGSPS